MNIELEKSEIVSWIRQLKDIDLIEKIKSLKLDSEKKSINNSSASRQTRKFGDGKHIITYVADDFNEPLDDFKEYME
ncbi:MAG: DUF2281 domain-containing protein [Cyclobacteriaceae bacterium]|nr:DUF2281 domain-containing protein [Cyclobacteriaceae bacterium]